MTSNNRTRILAVRAIITGLMAAAMCGASGCDESDDRDVFGFGSIFSGADSFGNWADDPFGWDSIFDTPDSFGRRSHDDCRDMILPDRDCY